VAYSGSFGGLNHMTVARLINAARAIRALAFTGMSGGDHLCHSLACDAQRGRITQIACDHFSPKRFEVLQFSRSACQGTHPFTPSEEVPGNRATYSGARKD
jgi:hypothetical protein